MTRPSLAVALDPEPHEDLAAAYQAWLAVTGRGCRVFADGARAFLKRWPDPQAWAAEPLDDRLAVDQHIRPFITFLMLHGWLRPGLDWLVRRKIPFLVRYGEHSPLASDIDRYQQAATQQGFSDHIVKRSAERVVIRLMIQTGRPLDALTVADLTAIQTAFMERAEEAQRSWTNDRALAHTAHAVLFHLGLVDTTAPNRRRRTHDGYEQRFYEVTPDLATCFLAYLGQLAGTHARSTVSGMATRLADFGRVLTRVDPELVSLADLDRQRHIEPYLAAVAAARSSNDGEPLSVGERRNRIITVARFLADIAEWGWPDAPSRRLIFSRDAPRLAKSLPRYLPPDVDRRLVAALETSNNRLFADALLLARATGLRVGEVVGLELDCVHEIPGHGAWLKVPADNHCDSERMVPLDEDTLAVLDRLAVTRSPGRPLPHPRTGRLTDFLLTHHGKRVSTAALRDELARVARAAGIEHVTPHQLRHTYATALVNAGVPLQALMALLGHTSAAMSLRYARLFDATVRADYERALTLAKTRLGPVLPERASLPLVDLPGHASDWRETDTIKARLSGGYCLRTAAQGVCPYTNICEHCPNFRTDATFLPILAAQRADADALARDAEERGWGPEVSRHRDLVARLDALIDQAEAG
jgi:integrase